MKTCISKLFLGILIVSTALSVAAQDLTDLTLVTEFQTKNTFDTVCGLDKNSNVITIHRTVYGECKWSCKPSAFEVLKSNSEKIETIAEYKNIHSDSTQCASMNGEIYALFQKERLVKVSDLSEMHLQSSLYMPTIDHLAMDQTFVVVMSQRTDGYRDLMISRYPAFNANSEKPVNGVGYQIQPGGLTMVDPVILNDSIIFGGYNSALGPYQQMTIWNSVKLPSENWKLQVLKSPPVIHRIFNIGGRVIGIALNPGSYSSFSIYEIPSDPSVTTKLIKTINFPAYGWDLLSDGKSLFLATGGNNLRKLYQVIF